MKHGFHYRWRAEEQFKDPRAGVCLHFKHATVSMHVYTDCYRFYCDIFFGQAYTYFHVSTAIIIWPFHFIINFI